MDLFFISILLLMLLIIICGAVGYCVAVGKKARRAAQYSEMAFDALVRLESRCEEQAQEIASLKDKAAEIDSQSAKRDKKADRYDRQYAALQSFQLKDYGLRFSGSDTGDEEVTADED